MAASSIPSRNRYINQLVERYGRELNGDDVIPVQLSGGGAGTTYKIRVSEFFDWIVQRYDFGDFFDIPIDVDNEGGTNDTLISVIPDLGASPLVKDVVIRIDSETHTVTIKNEPVVTMSSGDSSEQPKIQYVEGTTPSAIGNSVQVPHGLALSGSPSAIKVISFDAVINNGTNILKPPHHFHVFLDDDNVNVTIGDEMAPSSPSIYSDIFSVPFAVTITYIENQ